MTIQSHRSAAHSIHSLWLCLFLSLLTVVGVALFLPIGAAGQSKGKAKPIGSDTIPGHYIVVFKDSVDRPGRLARTQTAQRNGNLGFVYKSALKGYSAELPKSAVKALRNDPRIKYVSPDHRETLYEQTMPTGIDRIFAPANESLDIDGQDGLRVDADIAVIDSGIDHQHSDLFVYARTLCEDTVEGTTCTDNAGTPSGGHGTHVAGTVGAIDNGEGAVGVAPGARLWSVQVFNPTASESEVAAGVDWVTEHADEIEVANMSLGCPLVEEEGELVPCQRPVMYEAITTSIEAGVVYAVAAGNDAVDAKYKFPAYHPDVITVSALADYDGKVGGEASPTCNQWGADDKLASFSNFGEEVDVAAPGTCIYSTLPGGAYGNSSGTSMASPHVAGAAAILASAEKPENLEDVEAVRQTIAEEGNETWEDSSGDGVQEPLLDVNDAAIFAPAPQVAVTGDPEILSTTEATVHGYVAPAGLETEYYFEYGTSTEYGSKVPVAGGDAGAGNDVVSVEETIEVEGQTLYHYRLTATNAKGTFYGEDRLLGSSPPTVATGKATDIGVSTAAVNATVNPKGLPTTYKFEFGPTTAYVATAQVAGELTGTEAIEVPPKVLEGFDHSTTYHFRVVATNLAGTTVGEDETLTTQSNPDWLVQPTPKPYQEEEEEVLLAIPELLDVSCASTTTCMAVGGTALGGPIRHQGAWRWDGQEWTHTDLPLPAGIDGNVSAVSGISCPTPDVCVAIGAERYNGKGQVKRLFSTAWDGESWTAQAMPMPEPAVDGSLAPVGIACPSTDWCMAISRYTRNNSNEVGQLIHLWDGEAWSISPAPTLEGPGGTYLRAISCPAVESCLLLGGAAWAATWDGGSWTVGGIPTPEENEKVSFGSVSCVSIDACVASGTRFPDGSNQVDAGMAGHWDGQEWSVEQRPEYASPANVGSDIACTRVDECVIVRTPRFDGATVKGLLGGRILWTLSEHWDGEQWSVRYPENPTWPLSGLYAVDCVEGACTAVGYGQIAQRLRSVPTAVTEPASELTAEAAALNASVNPNGLSTAYRFEAWPSDWQQAEAPVRTNLWENPIALAPDPEAEGALALSTEGLLQDQQESVQAIELPDTAGLPQGIDTGFLVKGGATNSKVGQTIEVTEGTTYRWSVYFKRKSAATNHTNLRVAATDNFYCCGTVKAQSPTFTKEAKGEFERYDVEFTADETATWSLRVQSAGGSEEAEEYYLTSVLLEVSEDLGSYFPNPAELGSSQSAQSEDGSHAMATPTYAPAEGEGSAGEGKDPVAVSETLEGLSPSTAYSYRVVAANEEGTAYGGDVGFTTTSGGE